MITHWVANRLIFRAEAWPLHRLSMVVKASVSSPRLIRACSAVHLEITGRTDVRLIGCTYSFACVSLTVYAIGSGGEAIRPKSVLPPTGLGPPPTAAPIGWVLI